MKLIGSHSGSVDHRNLQAGQIVQRIDRQGGVKVTSTSRSTTSRLAVRSSKFPPCKVKDTWPILTWFKENAFDEIAPLRTYLKLGLYIQLTQLHWRVAIRPSSRGDQPKGFVSAKAHIGPGRTFL